MLIWDGVTVEDDVFLGPNVVFTNDLRPRAHLKKTREQLLPTIVRHGATLGAGVTVVCGTTIGHHSLAAAGSVITADVPARALVAGNPARRIGSVCCWGCGCVKNGRASAVLDPRARSRGAIRATAGAVLSRAGTPGWLVSEGVSVLLFVGTTDSATGRRPVLT